MAHHDRSIRERVIALAEEGGISASTAVRCPEVYCRGMATEIPEGWASLKAQRNRVMARIQPSSG